MKISEQVHMLTQKFTIPVTREVRIPRTVNFYLITGKYLYLIDTGTVDSFDLLQAYLPTIGRELSEIRGIFLTHSHPDHIGSANRIQQECNCEVYLHESEVDWVEDIDRQNFQRPVPGFHEMVNASCKITKPIANDTLFSLEDGLTLDATHTPGHSRGSISYYLQKQQLLFSGDAIMLPGELPIYGHVKNYLDSLYKIGNLPVTTTVLSAFTNPQTSEEFAMVLTASEKYIQKIDLIVRESRPALEDSGEKAFCARCLELMGLPQALVNPLLLKSFLAHVKYQNDEQH